MEWNGEWKNWKKNTVIFGSKRQDFFKYDIPN